MGLITILSEDNFTSQFYVKRVAIPEKAVFILTSIKTKWPFLAILWPNLVKCGFDYKKIFLQKYKPNDQESPLEKIKGLDAGMLPPCKNVLLQTLARCNYVAYLWKHARVRDPLQNIQPTDHGWKEVNGAFVQIWFTGSQMPNVLSETMEPEDVTDRDEDEDDDDDDDDNDCFTDDDSDDDDNRDDDDDNDGDD